jgi:hypothetical protein
MALIRWSPRRDLWDPFTGLAEIQDEVNRLFGTSPRRQGGFEGIFSPNIDWWSRRTTSSSEPTCPGWARTTSR